MTVPSGSLGVPTLAPFPVPILPGEEGVISLSYPVLDLRRYGWTGAADESTSLLNAIKSAQGTGLGLVSFPPGVTFAQVEIPDGYGPLVFRGIKGSSILRQKAGATAPALKVPADVNVMFIDMAFDGNHANQSTPELLDITVGDSNVEFVRCSIGGWYQFGVRLHQVNGNVSFIHTHWTDARCGGLLTASTTYGVHLSSTNSSNGRISFVCPVAKQTTVAGVSEFPPSWLQVAAVEGDSLTVEIISPDIEGYGASPVDGVSGVIDMYQYVDAFRVVGGSIRASSAAAIKMGNCRDLNIAGVSIDGDTTRNTTAAIFHSGYARNPSATYHQGYVQAIVRGWTKGPACQMVGEGAASATTARRYELHITATGCKSGVTLDGVGEVTLFPQINGCIGVTSADPGVLIQRCYGTVRLCDGFIMNGASYGVLGQTGLGNTRVNIVGVTFDGNANQHIYLFDASNTIPFVRIAECTFLGATATALLQSITRLEMFNSTAALLRPAVGSITTLKEQGNSWQDEGTLYSCSIGSVGGSPIAASTTTYASLTAGFNATESNRQSPIPGASMAKRLVVTTTSGQPVSGSLVFTVRKNGANTALAITIAAGSAAGVYAATNSIAFAEGDLLSISAVNNATGNSAAIAGLGVRLQ